MFLMKHHTTVIFGKGQDIASTTCQNASDIIRMRTYVNIVVEGETPPWEDSRLYSYLQDGV